MESKREQAIVGLFVLVASAVLVATVFTLTGAFAGAAVTYRAHSPFAGGLEPGATVRYAGGPKVGRVEKLHLEAKEPRSPQTERPCPVTPMWTSMPSRQRSTTSLPRRSSF